MDFSWSCPVSTSFCIFSVRFTSWQECIVLKLSEGHIFYLMCSSSSCEMAAMGKGVCSSRGSNAFLGKCSSPTWIWQVVSNGLPKCHLYLQTLVCGRFLWMFFARAESLHFAAYTLSVWPAHVGLARIESIFHEDSLGQMSHICQICSQLVKKSP
jgi:hypothetical protein